MITLIVDEVTRTEYIRYGFVKDMLNNLGEELPSELLIWFLEHSIPNVRWRLTLVAFEQSQRIALSYSELVVTSLVMRLGTH